MTPLRVVALADDGYTHLSRHGVRTLCDKRTRHEGTAGPPCAICMSLSGSMEPPLSTTTKGH
jgi:hypothetical protein